MNLESGVQISGNVLCICFPSEFLLHGADGYVTFCISFYLQAGRTGCIVIGCYLANGRLHARFQNTQSEFIAGYIGETEDAFVADVGAGCHFLPGIVYPCVQGMLFYSFTAHGDGFLNKETVDSDRIGGLNNNFFLVRSDYDIGVCIVVQQFFRSLGSLQVIGSIGLVDPFSYFFQHTDILCREASFTVGRNIEQKSGIASYCTFVYVEYIIDRADTLTVIIAVEPAFTDGSVGFGLLVVQILGLAELCAAA